MMTEIVEDYMGKRLSQDIGNAANDAAAMRCCLGPAPWILLSLCRCCALNLHVAGTKQGAAALESRIWSSKLIQTAC